MNARKVAFSILFGMLLMIYTMARFQVDDIRADYTYRLNAAALPISSEMMMAIAGEFKGITADYLLLEAANFIGSKEKGTPSDWDAVARLLDQSSSLDPYFRQTYMLTQATLPWRAQKIEETLNILERSNKYLTWDWLPSFFIGFDYHFFLKDNFTASKKLMEASTKADPVSAITLSSWAARLASKAGQTRTAIDFLKAIIEKTEDEETKKSLQQRILALEGVQELQSAIDQFKSQFGRIPDTLDELVKNSILPSIPSNPYDRPYYIKNGIVEF